MFQIKTKDSPGAYIFQHKKDRSYGSFNDFLISIEDDGANWYVKPISFDHPPMRIPKRIDRPESQ